MSHHVAHLRINNGVLNRALSVCNMNRTLINDPSYLQLTKWIFNSIAGKVSLNAISNYDNNAWTVSNCLQNVYNKISSFFLLRPKRIHFRYILITRERERETSNRSIIISRRSNGKHEYLNFCWKMIFIRCP